MSTIESLEITNFQRVSAVRIEPTNNVVMLFGQNGEGKTSVLNAIETGFCKFNAKFIKRPNKDGSGRADIKIKLTDGTFLHQKFTPSGPALAGTKPDGGKLGQRDLDQAMSVLGVDASAFITVGQKKQLEILLSIVKLPFVPAELEAEIEAPEGKRLFVGQQGKTIGDFTVDPSLPTEETSAGGIIASIQESSDLKRENAEVERGAQLAAEKVAELTAKISEITADLGHWAHTLEARTASLAGLPEPADTDELEAKLATAAEANAAIRANNSAREQSERKAALVK